MSETSSKQAEWLLEILDQGRRSLESLIQENHALRESLARTRTVGEGGGDAQARIRALEEEIARLTAGGGAGAGSSSSEAEEQFDVVSNLLVAALQLSATTRPKDALATLNELLLNVIGATKFELYFLGKDGERISAGLQSFKGRPPPASVEPALAEALRSRQIQTSSRSPQAVIPLLNGAAPVAVLVLTELLPHKPELGRGELEMCRLLSEHFGPLLARTRALERAGFDEAEAAQANLVDLVRI